MRVVIDKCDVPTISYVDGEFVLTCSTEEHESEEDGILTIPAKPRACIWWAAMRLQALQRYVTINLLSPDGSEIVEVKIHIY